MYFNAGNQFIYVTTKLSTISKSCMTFTTDVQKSAVCSDTSTEAFIPLLHCVVDDTLV